MSLVVPGPYFEPGYCCCCGLMAFYYSRHSSESLFLLFQGCSIGCDFCLTDPRHPENNGTIPTKVLSFNKCQMLKQTAIFRKSLGTRPTATRQASASHIVRTQKQRSAHTISSKFLIPSELPPLSYQDVLPKEYWTMNTHAVPRAENDSYQCETIF